MSEQTLTAKRDRKRISKHLTEKILLLESQNWGWGLLSDNTRGWFVAERPDWQADDCGGVTVTVTYSPIPLCEERHFNPGPMSHQKMLFLILEKNTLTQWDSSLLSVLLINTVMVAGGNAGP